MSSARMPRVRVREVVVKYEEDITRWSNAKKARFFMHVIAYLAIERGGEVRISVEELKNLKVPLGIAVDDGEMVIAVDMDHAPRRLLKKESSDG